MDKLPLPQPSIDMSLTLPVIERLVRMALIHTCDCGDARTPEVESVAKLVHGLPDLESMSAVIATHASKRHGSNVVDLRRGQWQRATLQLFETFVALDHALATDTWPANARSNKS